MRKDLVTNRGVIILYQMRMIEICVRTIRLHLVRWLLRHCFLLTPLFILSTTKCNSGAKAAVKVAHLMNADDDEKFGNTDGEEKILSLISDAECPMHPVVNWFKLSSRLRYHSREDIP